jgi:hypothetical protein
MAASVEAIALGSRMLDIEAVLVVAEGVDSLRGMRRAPWRYHRYRQMLVGTAW